MTIRRSLRISISNTLPRTRSKKAQVVDNLKVSVRKCDKKKGPSKVQNLRKKTVSPSTNNQSTNNKKSKKPLKAPVKKPSKKTTAPKGKKIAEKTSSTNSRVPVKKQKNLQTKQPKKSDKKVTKKRTSPRKEKTETKKSSPIIKSSKSKDTIKSEMKAKPIREIKSKESKLKQQMKLGRIFVKPTFPVLKRNVNSGDKKQGQFDANIQRETNNNIIERLEPKIMLRKVDRDAAPVRRTRKSTNH